MLSQDETIIIQHLLMDDEGVKPFPYVDCCGREWKKCTCKDKGYLTIGIGRNLDTVGLSDTEMKSLQMNDIEKVTSQIERNFPWFSKLNTPRRVVIFSMVFNLGLDGFKEFKKFIKCIESGDYGSGAREMVASKWASQVKTRAVRLAAIMKTGQF